MSTKMSGQGYLCTAACNLLLALPQCLYGSMHQNLAASRLVRICEAAASEADLLLALIVIVNARSFAEFDPLEHAHQISRKTKIRVVYPLLNVIVSGVLAALWWIGRGWNAPLMHVAVTQTIVCFLLVLSARGMK